MRLASYSSDYKRGSDIHEHEKQKFYTSNENDFNSLLKV